MRNVCAIVLVLGLLLPAVGTVQAGVVDNILGLDLWLDAGDVNADGTVLSDGDVLAHWMDKSGHFNYATATDDPTYQDAALNGEAVVRFDGNDLMTTAASFDNPYTIFTVSQMEGTQNFRLISSANINWLLGYHGGLEDVMHANPWVVHPGPAATTNPQSL